MPESSLATAWLHERIDRLRAGDAAAQDELVRGVADRMRSIAQRMLRAFPGVRAAADTSDVLQNTFVRLLAVLRKVRPDSTRDFFQLAAHLMRQELIDLLRRCSRRQTGPLPEDLVAPDAPPEQLEAWLAFHEAVQQLPADEREVVSLRFYHGWKLPLIAEVTGMDVRRVRRLWTRAVCRLRANLQDRFDELLGAI